MEFRIAATFTATLARLAGSEPALRAGKSQNWLSSGRASPLVLARTHDARALYVVDAKGGGRSSAPARVLSATSATGQLPSCRASLKRVSFIVRSGKI